MYLRLASISLLLSLFLFQSQGDLFRQALRGGQCCSSRRQLRCRRSGIQSISPKRTSDSARVYSAKGKYQDSIDAFESANTVRRSSTEVLIDLSIAYFHAGQYVKGIEPLERVIAARAANPTAHHMLGKTWFMMGEFEKASRELEQTLKLTPSDYDAEYTLGLAF
jgi:tetratricopeptide (TPR) repeat protein